MFSFFSFFRGRALQETGSPVELAAASALARRLNTGWLRAVGALASLAAGYALSVYFRAPMPSAGALLGFVGYLMVLTVVSTLTEEFLPLGDNPDACQRALKLVEELPVCSAYRDKVVAERELLWFDYRQLRTLAAEAELASARLSSGERLGQANAESDPRQLRYRLFYRAATSAGVASLVFFAFCVMLLGAGAVFAPETSGLPEAARATNGVPLQAIVLFSSFFASMFSGTAWFVIGAMATQLLPVSESTQAIEETLERLADSESGAGAHLDGVVAAGKTIRRYDLNVARKIAHRWQLDNKTACLALHAGGR